MPIPDESLVALEGTVLLKGLLSGLRDAKRYWAPLNSRQDLWANMYLLLDVIQQSKPLGIARRFVSNEPRTGFDAAHSILTRNPTTYRIPVSPNASEDERLLIGDIERTCQGFNWDMDELFSQRLDTSLWKQIHFQGLLRGGIWGKFHVTTEALEYRGSPLVPEIFDARLTFPHVDEWGLNHVYIEKPTTVGALFATWPHIFPNLRDKDPFAPAVRVEFWSNDRMGTKGIHAVMGLVGSSEQTSVTDVTGADGGSSDARFIIPPFFHGYTPDELPVVGVAVNGAKIDAKPTLRGRLEKALTERADLLAMSAVDWHGANSNVAEKCRGILSSVEDQVPQYNELIATVFQHLTLGTYPTWLFRNPAGDIPPFKPGINAKIALKPNESVEQISPQSISSDAYRLIDLLREEREKGVLSSILQAVTPNSLTGVALQQQVHAALNTLEPYKSGGEAFGTRMMTSILAQTQRAAPALGTIELTGLNENKSFFLIEFDPQVLQNTRKFRPVPVMKPALPDDLAVRVTAARALLDPRAPMLSLLTVLETILEVEDPQAEIDRIWEDMAQRDPVLMPEQIAQALDRLGEPEMAARMRDVEMQASIIEELKLRQLTGNGPGNQNQSQEPRNPAPEAGPISTSTTRDGSSQQFPEGMEGLGNQGEQVSV